jgi:RUN and FYVE domain-containing protein 1
VKHLLETAMRQHRVVEANEVPLVNFFVTFENILTHGLKAKKSLLGATSSKDPWPVLELISRLKPEAVELCKSVRDMPHVRTSAGRARTWIRMAFMQKRLADYFNALIDHRELLTEFYEDGAFVMSEEAVAIGGLLIGLNVIECNQWCARDEGLDAHVNVIDLKHYLKSIGSVDDAVDGETVSDQTKELLDQKNYLEELNRKLTSTISNLKQKLSNPVLDKDNHFEILPSYESDSPAASAVVNGSSSLSVTSNTPPLSEADDSESRLRREIESLTHSGNEMAVAMKLLEKDVHEKQDTIISIRRQLEDIKAINIQMFHKIKQYESDIKDKDSKIAKLDQKVASCLKTITQLESRIKSSEERKVALEELKEQQEIQIKEKDQKSSCMENDLKHERERRMSLKKLLDDQESEVTRLSIELEEAKSNLSEYNRLRKEYMVLQKKCSEYELSLEEVGGQLKE